MTVVGAVLLAGLLLWLPGTAIARWTLPRAPRAAWLAAAPPISIGALFFVGSALDRLSIPVSFPSFAPTRFSRLRGVTQRDRRLIVHASTVSGDLQPRGGRTKTSPRYSTNCPAKWIRRGCAPADHRQRAGATRDRVRNARRGGPDVWAQIPSGPTVYSSHLTNRHEHAEM